MARKQVVFFVLISILSASAVFTVTPARAATITVTSKLDTADPGHRRQHQHRERSTRSLRPQGAACDMGAFEFDKQSLFLPVVLH